MASVTSAKNVNQSSWLDWFNTRSLPHFGQLATWLLLGASLWLARYPLEIASGSRQGPASLLTWLPGEVLSSPLSFWTARGLLVLGVVLWFWRMFLPWSCWLTVIAFTSLWSLHVENSWHTNHCFQMTNNLLYIQALWETLCAREIRAATAAGKYWQTPLYPRWVTLAAVAYIGIFHTAAGLSKLTFSGPGWANGVSLQIWTHLWGRPWSPTTWLILNSRTFTQVLQAATLVVETCGVLAVFPRLRTWIGLATVGFYVGVLMTFDYGFQLNLLFTAVYLLPVERWVESYVRKRNESEVASA
jgi:hypothetical protein